MITRAEAEALAAQWARNESEQRGYGCEPELAEFDLGYVVWTRPPATIVPLPGDGARTVIDRETGVLSTWPSIPPDDIAELYRDRRPRPSATVDPAVALRRLTRRHPAPTTAAHLTANGHTVRAQGAKGDQQITHHPLVQGHLNAVPVRARVRGVDRHAELLALSDTLHELDRVQGRPLRMAEARDVLAHAEFQTFLVRDRVDPIAGRPIRPCETCIGLLVDFAVLPWPDLAYTAEWRHASDRIPFPGRFPSDVARTLAGGGWIDLTSLDVLGVVAIKDAISASGGRLRVFDAARRAITEFPGVGCGRRGPGMRRAIRLLTLDPVPGAYAVRAIEELAEVLGAAVFPIGIEGGDAIVAIDERGRVFLLDQAGEWFVGADLDEALVGLLSGDGRCERLRDDGTW